MDAVDALDPATQRLVARWSARHAYADAQLDHVDWITPALAAMDLGQPLTPPFDNSDLAWNRLFEDESVPKTVITTLDGDTDNFLQQAMAFPAIETAYDEKPAASRDRGTAHRRQHRRSGPRPGVLCRRSPCLSLTSVTGLGSQQTAGSRISPDR